MSRFNKAGLILVVLLPIIGGACTTVSKQSPMMKATNAQFTVDAETMRVRVRSLAGPFGAYIEESGDEILEQDVAAEVRRQALIWKADGLPTVRAALFRPDPLVSLLDSWALSEQLIDYFDTGPGRQRLGDQADIPLEAARLMKADVLELVAGITSDQDLSAGTAFVDGWAREHPIRVSIAGRETILREAGTFKSKSGTGGLKLVGSLAVTMDDMLKQIEGYTANIPKQARWEAELAVLEMVGPENFDHAVAILPAMLDSAEVMAGTVQELPSLVSTEREAVLSALRRERIESLVFLRQERLETLAQFSAERVAVLEHTEQLRIAITEAIHAEVESVSEMIQLQRAQTMVEAEEIAGRTVDGTFERAADLIDHIFLRVVLALVLIFVGCVLLVLLAWRLFRNRPATA